MALTITTNNNVVVGVTGGEIQIVKDDNGFGLLQITVGGNMIVNEAIDAGNAVKLQRLIGSFVNARNAELTPSAS